MIFFKKNSKWTDFSQPSKIVIADAIEIIGSELKRHDYKYRKNDIIYKGDLKISDFKFVFNFKGSKFNKAGGIYKINCHFTTYTKLYEDFFKDFTPFLSNTTILCSRPFGYLMDFENAIDGQWNLQKIHPKEIAKQIKKYGFSSVNRIKLKHQIIDDLCNKGSAKEFSYDVQALKYLMCFGSKEQVQKGLNSILEKKNYTEKYLIYKDKLKRNISLAREDNNLIASIAQLMIDYEKLK